MFKFLTKDKNLKKDLSKILGFTPGNTDYYRIALIHKSASYHHSQNTNSNNERLEYLGDAILDAIIAEFLFQKFKDKDEGFLTKLRSKIVKRSNLDKLAIKIGLDKLIVFKSYNNEHKHIYGNAFEALIGAVYLDKGYKKTKKLVVKRLINKYLDLDELIKDESDYKSRLIEWGQKNKKEIVFEITEKYNEQHRIPIFVSCVKIADESYGEGEGRSKKEAEQNAAESTIKQLILLNLAKES